MTSCFSSADSVSKMFRDYIFAMMKLAVSICVRKGRGVKILSPTVTKCILTRSLFLIVPRD